MCLREPRQAAGEQCRLISNSACATREEEVASDIELVSAQGGPSTQCSNAEAEARTAAIRLPRWV